jgi:hypothetical protein
VNHSRGVLGRLDVVGGLQAAVGSEEGWKFGLVAKRGHGDALSFLSGKVVLTGVNVTIFKNHQKCDTDTNYSYLDRKNADFSPKW